MCKNLEWQPIVEELLQHTAEATLIFDPFFKIVGVNDIFCKLIGQEKNTIINQTVEAFFPGLVIYDPAATPAKSAGEKIYHTIGVSNYEVKLKQIFSDSRQIQAGFIQLVPVNQEIAGIWQPALLNHLLEQATSGLAVFDPSGAVLYTNSLMLTYLGLNPSQTPMGKSLASLLPAANKPELVAGIKKAIKGKYVVLPKLNFLNDNNFFRVKFEPLLSQNHQLTGGIMVWQDITALEPPTNQPEPMGLPVIVNAESLLTIWITQIEERKRIASKIHNSLGQILYGFKMEFLKRGKVLPEKSRIFLTNLITEAINETKFISFELMPAMLEDFGLEATLEELVNKQRNAKLKLSYFVSGLTDRLDPNLEIIIFSVIQELTNNVIKHANATKARIYLELENDIVTIKVIDNGKGFEKGKLIYALKSTGLRNIKNSLKLFNGQIKISSQIGKGSLVTVQIPLQPNVKPMLTKVKK